ncbi:PKD domain-containing protein [Candidatus Bathyarchaeota archaeon]|nr:PKD domain-containing protein [Candidatus Bathyarchaeota archaeon]
MYIAGNTFNDLKSHRRGIGFWNAGSGHNLESPIITGNTINGIPGATGSFGIDFYGLTDNTVITHNKITGTDTAIFLRNSDAPGTQIHYNCIAGNNVGVNWTIGSGTVNATLNWWGNSTGPRHPTNPSGIGDKVTDNVSFYPWSPSTFDYSPKHYPLVGSPVTFDASAAFGPCSALKTITSYTWNFSDGTPLVTTTNPVTVHSFDDFGVFKVTLTTNYNDMTTYVCYVLVQVAQIPTASFNYSPAPPAALDATTFDASSSTPNGGTLIEYKWNFGDGNVTTTANPITTHVYASDGTYNVTLTVRDDEDLSNSTWKLVGVLKHDVAVVNVAPYRSWIYGGRTVNINVTVTNLGNFTEAIAVTLYFNITANQTIGTQTVELVPAETRTLTFTWDTHGVPYCHNYTITAVATVRFDINTTNNSAEGYIKIRILGDINGDGTVDVRDVAAVANAFGAYPGHPRWNPDLDMKLDNKIDVADIAVIAKNFGIVCP